VSRFRLIGIGCSHLSWSVIVAGTSIVVIVGIARTLWPVVSPPAELVRGIGGGSGAAELARQEPWSVPPLRIKVIPVTPNDDDRAIRGLVTQAAPRGERSREGGCVLPVHARRVCTEADHLRVWGSCALPEFTRSTGRSFSIARLFVTAHKLLEED
jgi:hypothetical protein